MLISKIWEALLDVGIEPLAVDADHIALRRGEAVEHKVLVIASRPLNPSDVAELIGRHDEPGLLVVPAASQETRGLAEAAGWSWLVHDDAGVHGKILIGGERSVIRASVPREDSGHRKRGQIPWGSLTVIRRLLERPAGTQGMLAGLAGVSQPRVAQTLGVLADRGLVRRKQSGWAVSNIDGLLETWLSTYPGPGGITTYWYGLESPREQCFSALEMIGRQAGPGTAVVSGDVAADLVAPWRIPARAVIYAREGYDLSALGLTPSGAQEATLEFIVPRDPGVWPAQGLDEGDVGAHMGASPLADSLQIFWDLRRAPGPDAIEAADRFWRVVRERSMRSHRAVT